MTEAGEIITSWLKDEFSKNLWTTREDTHYDYNTGKSNIVECVQSTIGGITVELRIDKDLAIDILVKTPYKPFNKVRTVHLTDPTSIGDLQEVVRHTIKITTNPFMPGI